MYLLDTMVLSELRKTQIDRRVAAWFRSVRPADLFLSAITIAEVEAGIEKQRSANAAFADRLQAWLETVIRVYADRVLPIDAGTARRWGQLVARIGHEGLDLAIAATALEHGLAMATRNVAHFAPTGVATVNPFGPRRGRMKP